MSVIAEDINRIAVVEKARGYWATVGRRLLRDLRQAQGLKRRLRILLGAP